MTRLSRTLLGLSRTLLGLALLVLGGSCTSPATQLVVSVDTPMMIPAELDAIEIVVTGPSGIQTGSTENLNAGDAPALPLTLGVTPLGEALGPIDVVAIGRLAGAERVRTTARVTLVEGETRLLTLALVTGCVGRTCDFNETCGAGGCQLIQRDDLPLFTGDVPRYTMQDACDALPWDEDGDGEASTMCGGLDCADQDSTRAPGVPEECDAIDNNCDGRIDPDCDCAPDGVTEPCATACGSTGERTCSAGAFGECVVPEETCNGIDDDCDGLVDEGQTYVGQAELRISGEGQEAVEPRIVAVEGGWRVVYSQPGEGGGQYLTRRDTPVADWVAPRQVGGVGLEPDLAVGVDGLMLTWTRRVVVLTNNFDRLSVRPLNLDGSIAGPRMQLEDDVSSPARPRVVWDGLALFRLAYHDGSFRVRSVDPTGAAIGGPVNVTSERDNPADFIFEGDRYAAAWTRSDEVYFLSTDASLVPTQITLRDTNNPEQASLAGSGGGYLVAWFDAVNEAGMPDTRSLRITLLEGETPGEAAALLSPSTGGDGFPIDDIEPPGVLFGGGQYLVTWADQRDGDQEIYFARISEAGDVVQAATRLTDVVGNADGTSIAFVDGHFGVVWSDERSGNPEVFFAEVACDAPGP